MGRQRLDQGVVVLVVHVVQKRLHLIVLLPSAQRAQDLQYLFGLLAKTSEKQAEEDHPPGKPIEQVLLDKPSGRRCDIEADYVGFTVDDRFIVDYGFTSTMYAI